MKLGDYFGRKPVILVPGYYGCPMLCTLVLNGLIGTLQDLRMNVGDQFEVVNFSIDPTETPALASAKKRSYLRSYGRPGAEKAGTFSPGTSRRSRRSPTRSVFTMPMIRASSNTRIRAASWS